jgi:hypothetical protein
MDSEGSEGSGVSETRGSLLMDFSLDRVCASQESGSRMTDFDSEGSE